MGADLICVIMARKSETKLNWDAAHNVVNAIPVEDWPPYVIDWVAGEDDDYAREWLHGVLNNAQEAWDEGWRDTVLYGGVLGGLDLFIIGGTSWGDTFEGLDEYAIIDAFDEIAYAIGFLDLKTGGERQVVLPEAWLSHVEQEIDTIL